MRSSCRLLLALFLLPALAHGQRDQTAEELGFFVKRATIQPSLVRLDAKETQSFKVVLQATYLKAASVPEPGQVRWLVNDVPGGSAELGFISEAGVYTAPARRPTPGEVHIGAEVEGSANRFLFATVILGDRDPSYRLIGTWSEPLENAEHFRDPHGIALDREGNLLIADQGNSRVMRFTPEGAYLGEVGLGAGRRPGEFTEPRAVITDDAGNIWVTDSKGDRPRIQVFGPDGGFQRIFAEKGILPGQILRGHGLGFDRERRLFVVDVDNFRVSAFTHAGEFLYSWGQVGIYPGQLNAPHGIVVDRSGDVFVMGYYGPTQKFDSRGHFLFAFGHGDPPDGPAYFHAMSGDRWGNVYLMVRTLEGYGGELQKTDSGKRLSIMKFNNNGSYVTGWSLSEPDHRESWAVVGDDGKVYSLFRGEKQLGVQIFQPE